MEEISKIFKYKVANAEKLKNFGFKNLNNKFILKKLILDNQFTLNVVVENNKVSTKLFDNSTNDEYILYTMPDIVGSFVGEVRTEVFQSLQEISENCFETEIFSSVQAKEVIEYVRKTYSRDLEFLWPKFSNNAIWRRDDNKKWFGLIMSIPKSKLGFESEQLVEVLNLRMDKLAPIVDNKFILSAYHMNKISWCSICLDGSVPTKKIYKLLEESYNLAKK